MVGGWCLAGRWLLDGAGGTSVHSANKYTRILHNNIAFYIFNAPVFLSPLGLLNRQRSRQSGVSGAWWSAPVELQY